MRFSTRIGFSLLSAASAGLLAAGLVIGEIARLNPCHLCNFQRLLYMALSFVALCGALLPTARRLWSTLFALASGWGVVTAVQQSWMQYAPQSANECGFGDPTLVEQVVDWLGMQWPAMFMVTGSCTSKDWVFLGLSLANWSGVCFLLMFAVSLWLLFRQRTPR